MFGRSQYLAFACLLLTAAACRGDQEAPTSVAAVSTSIATAENTDGATSSGVPQSVLAVLPLDLPDELDAQCASSPDADQLARCLHRVVSQNAIPITDGGIVGLNVRPCPPPEEETLELDE